jgi:hypothetical protein
MRLRLGKEVATALCGALLLSASGRAEIVVEQHTGGYTGEGESPDYSVAWFAGLPRITILRPWNPEWGPYDFDCYDRQTQAPEPIDSITAASGIGDVRIRVGPHDGRQYGATNVGLLQFDPDTGVNGTVEQLVISGDLGADGPTIFANGGSAEGGALDFHDALSPITITGHLLGDFTCNSAGDITIAADVPATSMITLANLDSLVIGTSDVPANLEGTLLLLNGVPQPPEPTNVVVIHGALNGTIDLNHGDVRQGAMLRATRGGHGDLINGGVIQSPGGVWFATAAAPGEVPCLFWNRHVPGDCAGPVGCAGVPWNPGGQLPRHRRCGRADLAG